MPLDDAPEIRLRDRIFQGLFHLFGREPKTFSLLHRLLLTASQMVGWDGEKSTFVKTLPDGRLDIAPITVGVTAPMEPTVVLSDEFEGVFNWTIGGSGTDYIGERRAEAAFHGDYGLYLRTRVTGAAAGDAITASRKIALQGRLSISYFLRFCPSEIDALRYIDIVLNLADGTGLYHPTIRRDHPADVWQYKDKPGQFQTIPGLDQLMMLSEWHALGIELDLLNHTYGILTFLGQTIDLSNIEMYKSSSVSSARILTPVIEVIAETALRPCLYVDDVLVREVL